jgi:hypothetical protein
MSDAQTTSSLNLRELLALPTDDPSIHAPQGLPNGHYVVEILSHEWRKINNDRQTDYLRYSIGRLEPTADVTEDTSGFDFGRIELRADFFITPDAIYRLRDAMNNVLGAQPGRSFDERIPEMVGARIQVLVTRDLRDGKPTGFNSVDTRTMVAAA